MDKVRLDTSFVNEKWIKENYPNERSSDDKRIELLVKQAELLNGQIAIVEENSGFTDDKNITFYGLEDDKVYKEYVWLIEQDDFIGTYSEREKFDKDWDNGEYESDVIFTIPRVFIKENV